MSINLYSETFDPVYAGRQVLISEVSTGIPAKIYDYVTGEAVNAFGMATLDSGSTLNIRIDTSKAWVVKTLDGITLTWIGVNISNTGVSLGNSTSSSFGPTLSIGTVTTVEADQPATVINVGTSTSAVLNMNIPKGPQGVPGSTSAARTLSQRAGGSLGYSGHVTGDSFGMHWLFTPIHWGLTTGNNAGVRYDKTSDLAGTESSGWVRVFLGFDSADGSGGAGGLFAANSTNFTVDGGSVAQRLEDWRYILRFWHGKGKKVLVCLDYQPSAGTTGITLFRDRLIKLLQNLPIRNAETGTAVYSGLDFIDAIEPVNEPYGPLVAAFPGTGEFVSIGLPKLAEVMRVTYTLFKTYSPRTIVCTPCFQGGEVAAVEGMLAASAAGISCRGSTGTGTRGEQFLDVISYHPYTTVSTLALANAALISSSIERELRSYSSFIQTAVTNRRQSTDGGSVFWAGKPDPEFWATEVNVTGDGGNPTTNSSFRMQAFNVSDRGHLILACMLGCFASGYSKVFPYAVDHSFDLGPWTPAGFMSGASGDLRVTSATPAIFDGDIVFFAGGNLPYPMQGTAYNASSNGLAYDVSGISSSLTPSYSVSKRWALGGWHQQWNWVQSRLIGDAQFGFTTNDSTADPQLTINDSNVRRKTSGRLVKTGL